MSVAAAQAGLSQNIQTSVMSVNGSNGATGTLSTSTVTGTSITIQNPNSQTVGTSITIPVPQFPQQGQGGTSGQGLIGQGLTFPQGGAGGGYIGSPGGAGGSAIPFFGGMWPQPRNLTEDDLKNFLDFFGKIFSGFVLVDNETTQKKEVFPIFEGFQVFQLAKNMGQKVNVTMLDQKTAEVLYGKK